MPTETETLPSEATNATPPVASGPAPATAPAGNALVDAAEIESAIKETIEAGGGAEIPSLSNELPKEPSKAAAPPAEKKRRFTIGAKSAQASPAESAAAVAAESPPAEARSTEVTAADPAMAAVGSVTVPHTPLSKRIYRVTERVLAAVDAPFSWIPPRIKNLAGIVALCSIIVSAVLAVLLPAVMPRRDAGAFIRERVAGMEERKRRQEAEGAAAEAAAAAAPADAHGAPAAGGAHGSKPDAHGGAGKGHDAPKGGKHH